jgi:hypothetical protein
VKEYQLTGFIRDGVLKLRGSKAAEREFKRWRDTEVIVTVERAHATRSLLSNSLYWAGYVNPVAEHTGYSPKQIHRLFKRMFLPKERIEIVNSRTGVVYEEDFEQLTTTTLTKFEFSEFLNEIQEWVIDTFDGKVIVGSNREDAA